MPGIARRLGSHAVANAVTPSERWSCWLLTQRDGANGIPSTVELLERCTNCAAFPLAGSSSTTGECPQPSTSANQNARCYRHTSITTSRGARDNQRGRGNLIPVVVPCVAPPRIEIGASEIFCLKSKRATTLGAFLVTALCPAVVAEVEVRTGIREQGEPDLSIANAERHRPDTRVRFEETSEFHLNVSAFAVLTIARAPVPVETNKIPVTIGPPSNVVIGLGVMSPGIAGVVEIG